MIQQVNKMPKRELNISDTYCCFTLKCVIINEASYCLHCAAYRFDSFDGADVRLRHCTYNEVSYSEIKPYNGPTMCAECGCLVYMVRDVADCAYCMVLIHDMYNVAIETESIILVKDPSD